MERINISSRSEWEKKVGYSRAVRVNNVIEVAGTTATINGEVVGKDDPYLQTRFILEKIADILKELGSSMKDVVRTRMYVVDISHWNKIGRAHSEFFNTIKPAATMVEVKSLIHRDLLVEVEITAIVNEDIN
jgi:enamine deaminase RidA (YjgF/YER057c/UK114 family)